MASVFVEEVHDPATWNSIVEAAPYGAFPQLWEWGEARTGAGLRPLRLVVRSGDDSSCVGAAQILIRPVPAVPWTIGHAPRGPLSPIQAPPWPIVLEALRRHAAGKGIGTLWFDPAVAADSDLGRLMLSAAWRRTTRKGEPSSCSVASISGKTDLWAGIRRRYRESIRRAERVGVETFWADDSSSAAEAETALAHFLTAYRDVAYRHHVRVERAEYYRRLWQVTRATGHASILYAVHEGRSMGALLHLKCGNELTFYAGGQVDAGEKLGVSKLLLWRGLQRAQADGLERYNMWGTNTPGLLHFKAGFGGREERYVGSRALPVRQHAHLGVNAADLASRLITRVARAARDDVIPDPANWPG